LGPDGDDAVEGRERYAVTIRYPRDLRSDPQSIARDVQVPLPGGGTVPLGEVAKVELTRGATSIRTENGQLAVYVFVDIAGRDLGGYVAEAQRAVATAMKLPPGTYVSWSGQFEYLERAEARLKVVVPVTLLIVFLLLYLNFRALTETLIVAVAALRARRRHLADWCSASTCRSPSRSVSLRSPASLPDGRVMLIYLEHAMSR